MSDIINLNLGDWPTDEAKQVVWMGQFMQNLRQFELYTKDRASYVIHLEQASEPTQNEWELAWITQTGEPMPISKGALFYWWDSVTDSLGGSYGVLLDDTVIRRRDAKYARGGVVVKEDTVTTAAVTGATHLINNNLSSHPALTFSNNQVADIEFEGIVPVTYNSGTGNVGMDFLLDGVRVGTTLFSLSDSQAIFSLPGSGVLMGIVTVPNVPAGDHTVQMVVGSLENDPTPANVDYGIQTLSVKGYIR